MTFSEIDRLRAALDLTQKAFCSAAGIHETTYSAIKNGRSTGTGATLRKLAETAARLRAERAAS